MRNIDVKVKARLAEANVWERRGSAPPNFAARIPLEREDECWGNSSISVARRVPFPAKERGEVRRLIFFSKR